MGVGHGRHGGHHHHRGHRDPRPHAHRPGRRDPPGGGAGADLLHPGRQVLRPHGELLGASDRGTSVNLALRKGLTSIVIATRHLPIHQLLRKDLHMYTNDRPSLYLSVIAEEVLYE